MTQLNGGYTQGETHRYKLTAAVVRGEGVIFSGTGREVTDPTNSNNDQLFVGVACEAGSAGDEIDVMDQIGGYAEVLIKSAVTIGQRLQIDTTGGTKFEPASTTAADVVLHVGRAMTTGGADGDMVVMRLADSLIQFNAS